MSAPPELRDAAIVGRVGRLARCHYLGWSSRRALLTDVIRTCRGRNRKCVTPANCQMIIAVSQGTKATQAIDRDLFDESLKGHHLPRVGTDKLLWLDNNMNMECRQ